jgi:hypothetical protein
MSLKNKIAILIVMMTGGSVTYAAPYMNAVVMNHTQNTITSSAHWHTVYGDEAGFYNNNPIRVGNELWTVSNEGYLHQPSKYAAAYDVYAANGNWLARDNG